MNSEEGKNLIARILISGIFIYTIPIKIINFEETADVIISKKQLII